MSAEDFELIPSSRPPQTAATIAENKPVISANPVSNPKDLIGRTKAGMSAVPFNVLAELGVAMMEGKHKYGRHNFRATRIEAEVYYDAILRHVGAWWEGEDIDPDSGLNHITKAIATLTVLRDAMLRGNWEDNRPPVSSAFYPDLNARAAEIVNKHKDKPAPKHYTIKDQI